MAASLLVNNRKYDFASLEFAVADGTDPVGILQGFDEINYSDNVDREKIYGASRTPIDATDGVYDAEGSVTLHRNVFDALSAYAKASGKGMYQLELTLTVSYSSGDDPVITDTITKVKLASRENAHSQGPENLVVPCDLFIGGLIYHDGLGPFGETL